ncbi:YhcH/YjgK/YiaL family protein [Paenibacillus sp. S150]|uniref:YhcH/YjgK/YiaL family protein n=1 Tax=Paenibacillus sp. S150 TaxID=2749826 RepID=UPI001C569F28|nr:YhcH/YjgK/YiaL family protein [Paenibacillus sp. S150]MBW4081492.1 YhcH/YjgK/YiaL family protein [Paenibacillus sp. S150]
MIVDTLGHLLENKSAYGEKIQRGLQFLHDTDFAGQAAGRHEVNDEMFYFINGYETKAAGECFWEAHRVNLDLHYILEGTEKIGYAAIEQLEVKDGYSAEKDAIFFTGAVESAVTAGPGALVVCYPQDGHMTGIAAGQVESVRKVVLKIKL